MILLFLSPFLCVADQSIKKIFRIYDNRFHESSRSSIVYKSWPPLMSTTHDVLVFDPQQHPVSIKGFKGFSDNPLDQSLQLISTPYQEGKHFAEKPTDFIPIIDLLHKLHADGFVHGDIRAYNLVFGKRDTSNKPQGWLIDFDFGGKVSKVFYPPGYKQALVDGNRFGKEGQPIEKWHDWHALGYIIFSLHKLGSPHKSALPLGPEENVKRLEARNSHDHVTDTRMVWCYLQ